MRVSPVGQTVKTATPNTSPSYITAMEEDSLSDVDIHAVLNRNTPAARRKEVARRLGLLVVPIGSLLIFTTLQVVNSIFVLNSVRDGIAVLDNDRLYARVVVNLQMERGMTAMYLSSNCTNMDALDLLQEHRVQSQRSIDDLEHWRPGEIRIGGVPLMRPQDLVMILINHRHLVDTTGQTMQVDHNVIFYTNITQGFLEWSRSAIRIPTKFIVWRYMFFNSMFLLSTDAVGLQRALGATFATKCQLNAKELEWFNRLGAESEALEQLAFDVCASCRPLYARLYKKYLATMNRIRTNSSQFNSVDWQRSCARLNVTSRFSQSLRWFDDMTVKISDVQVAARAHYAALTSQRLRSEQSTANIVVALFVTVIVVESVGLFVMALWFSSNLQKLIVRMKNFMEMNSAKMADLRLEKAKTETLLTQLLPPAVVDQIRRGLDVEAESYSSVTVLITDIVNFTAFCAKTTPMTVIGLLNRIFR